MVFVWSNPFGEAFVVYADAVRKHTFIEQEFIYDTILVHASKNKIKLAVRSPVLV